MSARYVFEKYTVNAIMNPEVSETLTEISSIDPNEWRAYESVTATQAGYVGTDGNDFSHYNNNDHEAYLMGPSTKYYPYVVCIGGSGRYYEADMKSTSYHWGMRNGSSFRVSASCSSRTETGACILYHSSIFLHDGIIFSKKDPVGYATAVSKSDYDTSDTIIGSSIEYMYTYLGADDIDPLSVSCSGDIKQGETVRLSVTPSKSKVYAGTVQYHYEYSKNGGQWTTVAQASSSVDFQIPSGTQRIQFRVVASDDLGFVSGTYVVSPTYEAKKYAVTVTISPPGGGTISGAGSFYEGTSVTVRAVPADGYEFIGWEDGGSVISTAASYKFTVSKDRSLTAVFKQKLTAWVGVDSKARKGVELWVGVNGKARKAVKAWIGVEGKARRWL